MSSFTSVTSTRSPCRTRSSGPGERPSKVSASIDRPEPSSIVACRAVSVKRASGSPSRGPRRLATLTGFRVVLVGHFGTAAEVDRSVIHHVVRAGETAVPPHEPDPAEGARGQQGHERDQRCRGRLLRTTLGWRSVSDDGAGRHLRVAVVGSGPAAFYAAGHLLSSEEPHVRGRPDRAATHAVGPRPARGCPGSSEPEDGLARFRADRGATRLPLLRQCRGREGRVAG